MRRLLTTIFSISAGVALALTLFYPSWSITGIGQTITLVLFVVIAVERILGIFPPRHGTRIPPSQVAEIERLYFRSMREMLNDQPNLVQVVNDLQRILSIDRRYKNARHYLTRALVMQYEGKVTNVNSTPKTRNSAEFRRLQEQLIDPDPRVRKAVVMELIQYGEDAVDPLIALLMDEDSDVRVHAATALGWVGGRDAVQPLLVALQDENPYVRRYAARAMCWVVDETAIEGLLQSLQDEDNYVRQYAARALGWSQDTRAVGPLLELLSREENADVQEYVLTALDDLGEHNVRVERAMELTE
jgi:hypothetical protein